MQITKIIELMGLLGVGQDIPSDYDRAIYLKYINQAHFDLYNHTAAINDDLFINESLQTEANSTDVELDKKPLIVPYVYLEDNGPELQQLPLLDFINYKKNYGPNTPRRFMFKKNVVSIYPIMKDVQYTLDIWYVPQPTELKEITAEEDIPYPIAFHPTLVDGALYYLFQDEGGFRNSEKSMIHQAKWENGKSLLLSYLFNSSNKTVSTYSSLQ